MEDTRLQVAKLIDGAAEGGVDRAGDRRWRLRRRPLALRLEVDAADAA